MSSGGNNVRVMARFRPASKSIGHRKEAKAEPKRGRSRKSMGGRSSSVTAGGKIDYTDDSKSVVVTGGGLANKRFNFDYVFQPGSQQQDVFEQVARATVKDILSGYNGTIFAYGQTGSGKTYTMFGTSDQKGIIPRCAEALFNGITDTKVDVEEVYIKCSFVEIYQENVRDLLNPTGNKLRIREKQNGSTYIEGAAEEYCNTPDDIYRLINQGNKYRAVSSTDMNNQSSRSHSVLIINLVQRLANGTQLQGGLNLADLAGSERLSRTNVKGIGLKEAKMINQSLSALGNCINALTDKKRSHIPYRDSVLTWLLKDSLGGNAKTVLIVCCSPDGSDVFETIGTLRFAERAKRVKNTAKVNSMLTVEQYQKLVKSLREKISSQKQTILELRNTLASGGQLTPQQLGKLQELSGGGGSRPVSEDNFNENKDGGLVLEESYVGGDDALDTSVENVSIDVDTKTLQEAGDFLSSVKKEIGMKDEPSMQSLAARFLPKTPSSTSGRTPSPASMNLSRRESFQLPDITENLDMNKAEDFLKEFQETLSLDPTSPAPVIREQVDRKLHAVSEEPVLNEATTTPLKHTNTDALAMSIKTPKTPSPATPSTLAPQTPKISPEEAERMLIAAATSGDLLRFWEYEKKSKITADFANSAVHAAARGGNSSIVKHLIEKKAEVDARDKKKCTPLMLAVKHNKQGAIEYLIEAKADVNLQDENGDTALMYAARLGSEPFTEILVTNGADISLKNSEGLTAAQISRRRGAYIQSLLQNKHQKHPATSDEKAKLAARILAQESKDDNDLKEAASIYQMAAEKGDIEAMFALAECYIVGKGVTRDPEKAFEIYSSEILARNPKARTEKGRCYRLGLGVMKDSSKMIENFRKAADMMYPDARCELAWCFAKGEGIPKEPEIAFNIFSELSVQHHGGALCGLGYCHQKGLGIERDEIKAVKLYEESASKGYANAYTRLAKCFLAGKDENKAFLLFQEAATRGDRVGKYFLAKCYLDGLGVMRDPKKAAELFQEAANLGDSESLVRLGRCYVKGEGVDRDLERAVALYTQATDLDVTPGMIALGECYEKAVGVARDFKRAALLYKRAADMGDPRAILKLGECYEHAKGVKKDESKAFKCYMRAKDEGGLIEAATRVAWCYANGTGVERDGDKAFQMFSKGSKEGHKEALRGLGFCFEKGLGVKKANLRKAVQMYQKAAEAGSATAWSDLANCVVNANGQSRNNNKAFLLFKKSASMGDPVGNRKLGWCYVKGIGTEKDVRRGVQYYHRAAEMGDSMAISSLGVCYAKGMGVKRDQVKAFELFKRAAEMGNPTDICNLGVCYKKGTGVKVDHRKAAELYQKAADMGDAAAICNLGVCYYNGTGVKKDINKALSYWHEAAKLGNSAARHNLERCRNAKGKNKEKSLILASLAELVPPMYEEKKSVLERPLFKEPMNMLSGDDQMKRRKLAIEAFKMTIEMIQGKYRREATELARIKPEKEDAKASQMALYKKFESRLLQLIDSSKVLVQLVTEPKKRSEPKFIKPIQPKKIRR
mmetsp:Transcript_15176/g.22975  ORF Transcript_15176/g.22975 Transcript_15176/m.22975 type:complete len:1531 (-) Transcript_15176:63-4655(-)